MKKRTLFLLLFVSAMGFSQPPKQAALLETFKIDADEFVGFDKFGYYYLIKNNALIKTKGDGTVEYKNVATGKITRVDIENPLLLVLFYEQFNTVVLLDNQLNEVRKINFSDLAIGNNGNNQVVAHAVGLASQNRLWVYDSLTQQVGLFDYLKNDYRAITTPFSENLAYYQSDFNMFRWIDDAGNLYASDVFGKVYTYEKPEPHDRIQFVQDQGQLYSIGGKLFSRDLKNGTTQMLSGVENSFKNFYYKDQILAIFTNGGITNYKITLP